MVIIIDNEHDPDTFSDEFAELPSKKANKLMEKRTNEPNRQTDVALCQLWQEPPKRTSLCDKLVWCKSFSNETQSTLALYQKHLIYTCFKRRLRTNQLCVRLSLTNKLLVIFVRQKAEFSVVHFCPTKPVFQ